MQTLVQEKLKAALATGSNSNALVEAVFRFNLVTDLELAPNLSIIEKRKNASSKTREDIQAVLVRAEKDAGEAPVEVLVLPSVGSACVKAHPGYIKALIGQEEVVGATLNESLSLSAD
jgi:hypothetical protein